MTSAQRVNTIAALTMMMPAEMVNWVIAAAMHVFLLRHKTANGIPRG